MKFNGIRHRDDTFSHFIILDDYFSKEKQLYFYNYFNNQQDKLKFYNPHQPINMHNQNLFNERFEPLEEFTDKQIERLKKEYESLRGKEKSVRPERFAQLRKMMRRFPKANLLKLAKADIPILSSGARASLVVNHGMKFSQIPEDFIPYMEIFADDNKELSEQKKSNFKSVDPKVIDRIEKMMRGTRQEKDSIANMLNYFMPPEVVDMVRYKLKIVPKRGKIKF